VTREECNISQKERNKQSNFRLLAAERRHYVSIGACTMPLCDRCRMQDPKNRAGSGASKHGQALIEKEVGTVKEKASDSGASVPVIQDQNIAGKGIGYFSNFVSKGISGVHSWVSLRTAEGHLVFSERQHPSSRGVVLLLFLPCCTCLMWCHSTADT